TLVAPLPLISVYFFLFTPPPPPAFSPLSLHDALPIFRCKGADICSSISSPAVPCPATIAGSAKLGTTVAPVSDPAIVAGQGTAGDRKSTRLNSSHSQISYAVFCLKKKKNK